MCDQCGHPCITEIEIETGIETGIETEIEIETGIETEIEIETGLETEAGIEREIESANSPSSEGSIQCNCAIHILQKSQLNARSLAFHETYLTIGYRLIYVVLTVRFPIRKYDFGV